MMEFHVSRAARDRYGFDDALFGLSGNVILADFRATRRFTQLMNERRDAARNPERAILAGQLNAMGLIDEILHYVVALYRRQVDESAVRGALAHLEETLGREAIDRTLEAFAGDFPTVAVYRGGTSAAAWLAGATEATPNREVALEEMALLWLANANPAFRPFGELFDDAALARGTAYRAAIEAVGRWFETRPPFGPERQPLVVMLRAPAIAHPDSLSGQLRYIRERWGILLTGSGLLDRLTVSLDVLAEDERANWLRFHGGHGDARGHGDRPGLGLGDGTEEPERFSQDLDWMPRLVLMAKSTYVWLDQLSKTYGREIRTLDAIPDEELDRLARWGMSGLWLIGLWERSHASQEIKRRRGNPEAVASAYSLMDYRIADDLGGEAAYESLRDRAWRRGIRLASDMVPNHMGIDSTWVVEHPDRFLSLPYPPYPSYTYDGPDLSWDGRVGIFLEDHYWDSSDAAVTFKRVDRWTGDTRYIYHGNDGTSFPWNDTAQLDYLNPEVREAVIRTILDVARQFPVIRFDAAMTLAKRHIQRLWYPEPGSGGGIPSRAEHGIPKADFEALMPVEFWREVVDRVAAEAPDTLLLAEAFWMLEGYFVRTLGMHRVYNSAFMHMLRDEDNAGYRRLIKETLEFDPEILKRYVNFMNNPDEKTAVEQFGKGEKYFGIATLMATLPGLPMFGHGQVEGFGEKYGMEYRRAYHDEGVDWWLVERHERELFPLLHRREQFAEVADFTLYDFEADGGGVDENVFAFSNRRGGDRSLVVYHNRYGETAGRIRGSVGFVDKGSGSKALRHRSLAEGLDLPADDGAWTIFREHRTGLEYLRSVGELRRGGLWVSLDAYRTQVFLDFRFVHDGAYGQYGRLADRLGGRGVPSVDEALRELQLEPVHGPIRAALAALAATGGAPTSGVGATKRGARATTSGADATKRGGAPGSVAFADRLADALDAVAAATGVSVSAKRRDGIVAAVLAGLESLERSAKPLGLDAAGRRTVELVVVARALGAAVSSDEPRAAARDLVGELRLRPLLAESFRAAGLDEGAAWAGVGRVVVLTGLDEHVGLSARSLSERIGALVGSWLADPEARSFLKVNEWQGVTWFDGGAIADLARWSAVLAAISGTEGTPDRAPIDALVAGVESAASAAGYRVDALTGTAAGTTAGKPRAKGGSKICAKTAATRAKRSAGKKEPPRKESRKKPSA